ncbi:GGDEF domain-containing protein [Fulvimarina sp. MAC8]
MRERLYATFYTAFGPLIFGALNTMMVSTVAYLRSGNPVFLWITLVDAFLLALRYRARCQWGRPSDGIFIGGLGWAALMAVTTGVIIYSGDQPMMVIALASNFATIGGILGRNFAAPRYAIIQGMLIVLGYEIGYAFIQQDLVPLFLAQGVMFLIIGIGIVKQQREATIRALKGELREREQALKDPLTGVLNRRGLEDLFARRSVEDPDLLLFYLDLDEFKEVNDSYGHGVGDELLQQATARLGEVAPEDSAICRLGGDEFLILARGMDDQAIRSFGARICVKLATPFQVSAGLLVRIGVSVGVSRLSGNEDTLTACMARADQALYTAKRRGKNNCVIYQPDLPEMSRALSA